jgi:LysM repeat protein
MKSKIYYLMTSLMVVIMPLNSSPAQEKKEETYSISLVQTAETDKEIFEVEDKKVLAEVYTVKTGDYLWQIFRDRDLLKKRNLSELLSTLKKLNKSLTNLDLIHPCEKIVVPLIISPIKGIPVRAQKAPETTVPIEALKGVKFENYTVKTGDSLIRVVKGHYDIPLNDLHDEYLKLVRGLNPSIKDLSKIYPGQMVRLPIYTPQLVRMPIESEPSSGLEQKVEKIRIPTEAKSEQPKQKPEKKGMAFLSLQLGEIFTEMGEEWVQTGQHFIPLKSGGQINLTADSFPIVNLSSGKRVIVDLYHDLPEKMAGLIESSWENYRIVHLEKDDDLRGAFGKILAVADYQKINKLGEPLELGGDIPVQATADWIIRPATGKSGENARMMITITDNSTPKIPEEIKAFLGNLGIKAIDYPPAEKPAEAYTETIETLQPGSDISGLLEMVLTLSGQRFSTNVEIPVYQSKKADFNLIIKADFFLNINGKDCIIDRTGIGADIVSLLKEHQFSVLALSEEKDPSSIVSKTLDFAGIKFDSGPHPFMATEREDSRNIKITIPGIIFRDQNDQTILATHLRIPDELASFLSRKGYKILSLALF